MYLQNESLPTVQENLAMDEALVEVADRASESSTSEQSASDFGVNNEVLRLWELASPCVVLGRASKWREEIRQAACERDGVPVLRRVSGGATIIAGPGCLMYSVLISYQHRPAWRALDVAHREVMNRIRDAVQAATELFQLKLQIAIDGTCDLTIGGRKISGNAMRCKRNWMIYHGTIMYAMPLKLLSDYLQEPTRQPDYRMKRAHETFVANLLQPANGVLPTAFRAELERQLVIQWSATKSWETSPLKEDVERECIKLIASRYSNPEWHLDR